MDLIQHAGLLNTVLRLGPFYPQFIRDFIVNLPSSFDDPNSVDYLRLHVKGFCFSISPTIIKTFLEHEESPSLHEKHPSIEDLVVE